MEAETSNERPATQEILNKFEQLHKVTPLSKYLAMTLFILMPFLGGWVGYINSPEQIVVEYIYIEKEVETSHASTTSDIVEVITEQVEKENKSCEFSPDNYPDCAEVVSPAPGDRVGDFTVETIDLFRIVTSGTTTVSGQLSFSEMFDGYCLDVTIKDAWKIPRIGSDNRHPWFCLRGDPSVDLASEVGAVVVEINNYRVDARPMGTVDTAELVRGID